MSTDIAYLQELRTDLMEAAERATSTAPAARRTRAGRARRPVARWKLASGLVALVVVVAGVVGFLARGSLGDRLGLGHRAENAILAPAPPKAPGAGSDHALAPIRGAGADLAGHYSSSVDQSAGRFGIAVPGSGGAPVAAPGSRPVAGVHGVDGAPVIGPNIIKNGELDIRVRRGTFVEQFQKAVSIAERYDGYVQTSSTSGSTTKSGTMTIRVPADRFAPAVADLRVLGRVLRQEITGQDVTTQFVDLAARLQNAEVQEARLRKLLSTAPTVSATLDVNRVLSQTELLIEELRGQLRVLQNRTGLGTVHLAMEEQPPKVTQQAPPPTEPPVRNPKLGRALHQGVAGFLGVVFSVVVGIGYLLPVLVVGLVAWFVVRRVRRSRMATA